jgi:DNA-binding FadR family transcriptional regulator
MRRGDGSSAVACGSRRSIGRTTTWRRSPRRSRGGEPRIDTDLILAYDLEFHVAISRATHNTVMKLAMTSIHLARPRTNTLLLAVLEHAPVVEQHGAILAAIRDGDPDAASRRSPPTSTT